MTRYDPPTRARLQSLLEAAEALRAASLAYHEALDEAPVPSAGLSVGLHEDDGDVDGAARVLVRAELLDDLVERLTGVVDDAARKALAGAERAALATYATTPATTTPATTTKRGRR
jgi:hypothetical protein